MSKEEFYSQKNGKWSSAQNLAHLTLSAKLFSRALLAPKIALIFQFGLNFGAQKDLDWIDKYYKSAIIPSVTEFEPKMGSNSSLEYEKE